MELCGEGTRGRAHGAWLQGHGTLAAVLDQCQMVHCMICEVGS
jgi:hypothetical protein